jgi:hypothetical protein
VTGQVGKGSVRIATLVAEAGIGLILRENAWNECIPSKGMLTKPKS